MDEEKRKEIQLLIENPDNQKDSVIKKYARLVLPHIALVAVVCVYAIIGAFVFYSLESPHEDRLKSEGIQTVQMNRKELIDLIWQKSNDNSMTQEEWMNRMSQSLQKFNTDLYKAYKEQYVRFGDVRQTRPSDDPRIKRHRSSSKSRSETGGKLWTATSSLFFSATTMATIGYGNVVPVTTHGRLACVIFALFGAPLAIITIGDLGKFLSECTIWLYKRMIDTQRKISTWWSKLRIRGRSELDMESGAVKETGDKSNVDWGDIDRTEVPVLLVFIILLLYIAFGGILFSYIESWTYMDSFYYCFVSLTTIGFGDLVPEKHEYIVLMLIYLGVGLAITTMCIDLVGIQYIQKIHYFGRKFKGTDILQLLKRKRMLERQLAMGNTEEFINLMNQVAQEQQREAQPPPPPKPVLNLNIATESWQNDRIEEEGSLNSEGLESWHANEALTEDMIRDAAIVEENPMMDETLMEIMKLQELNVEASIVEGGEMCHATYIPRPPSPYSNSSADGRSLMYENWDNRSNGSTVSGPDISRRCSIQTPPSVGEREWMYDKFQSPRPSITSFEFSFDGPWPDLKAIATKAKNARRVASCPGEIERPTSPTLYSAIQNTDYFMSQSCSSLTSHPDGVTCKEDWINYLQVLDDVQQPLSRVRSPVYLHLSELYMGTELPEIPFIWPTPSPIGPLSPISVEEFQLHSPPERLTGPSTSAEQVEPATEADYKLRPTVQAPRSILRHEKPSPLDIRVDSIDDVISPLQNTSPGNSPLFDVDLGGFELVDSGGMSAEALLSQEDPVIFHKDMPVHSVHYDTVHTEAALESLMNAPESMLSSTVPPIMVADNYCFIVDGDQIKLSDIMGDDQWWRHTSRPTKYFYSEDLRKFFRVNCITAKGKIMSAKLANVTVASSLGVPPPEREPSSSLSPNTALKGASSSLPATTAVSSATTPRSSMSVNNMSRGEKVPLENVYKVIRFYSFWKTCTSFHRIVTMIDKLTPVARTSDFKRRLFVQYLWRNAKPTEKARVQKEFDPRRQRLLRFVKSSSEKNKKAAAASTAKKS